VVAGVVEVLLAGVTRLTEGYLMAGLTEEGLLSLNVFTAVHTFCHRVDYRDGGDLFNFL
jgi:hypothetical protein